MFWSQVLVILAHFHMKVYLVLKNMIKRVQVVGGRFEFSDDFCGKPHNCQIVKRKGNERKAEQSRAEQSKAKQSW